MAEIDTEQIKQKLENVARLTIRETMKLAPGGAPPTPLSWGGAVAFGWMATNILAPLAVGGLALVKTIETIVRLVSGRGPVAIAPGGAGAAGAAGAGAAAAGGAAAAAGGRRGLQWLRERFGRGQPVSPPRGSAQLPWWLKTPEQRALERLPWWLRQEPTGGGPARLPWWQRVYLAIWRWFYPTGRGGQSYPAMRGFWGVGGRPLQTQIAEGLRRWGRLAWLTALIDAVNILASEGEQRVEYAHRALMRWGLAGAGAAIGTAVSPGVGTAVGFLGGLVADWLWNAVKRDLQREVQAAREARSWGAFRRLEDRPAPRTMGEFRMLEAAQLRRTPIGEPPVMNRARWQAFEAAQRAAKSPTMDRARLRVIEAAELEARAARVPLMDRRGDELPVMTRARYRAYEADKPEKVEVPVTVQTRTGPMVQISPGAVNVTFQVTVHAADGEDVVKAIESNQRRIANVLADNVAAVIDREVRMRWNNMPRVRLAGAGGHYVIP